MEILEMINEWRKGCSNAGPVYDHIMQNPEETTQPEDCSECTVGLIRAIEQHEKVETFGGCITPNFHRVVDRLAAALKTDARGVSGDYKIVARIDIESLLHEFYRIDSLYRRVMKAKQANDIIYSKEESHRVC